MEAIAGRRSRRFCMGAEIPDGILAFKSKHKPLPLIEIEPLLVLSSIGGVTGWHFAIMALTYTTKGHFCGISSMNYTSSIIIILISFFFNRLAVPDLCSNEDILSFDSTFLYCPTHIRLVVIQLGDIDMSIADL